MRPESLPEAEVRENVAYVRFCEGFRMPAAGVTARDIGRPASETLQGRKLRLREVRLCGRRDGDLGAAGELADLDRAGPTSGPTMKRVTNERRVASGSVNCRANCDDWRTSGRTLPWLVERQRARR